MSWYHLCIELRLAILEAVAGEDPNITNHKPRGYYSRNKYAWAPYAVVSREWQEFFERRTFAALSLTIGRYGSDVYNFCAAITRCPDRLTYIVQLQLLVDVGDGMRYNDDILEEAPSDDYVFDRDIWQLFDALSMWKAAPKRSSSTTQHSSAWMRDDAMFRTGKFGRAVGTQLELGAPGERRRNFNFPLPTQAFEESGPNTRIRYVIAVGAGARNLDHCRVYASTLEWPGAFEHTVGKHFLRIRESKVIEPGLHQHPPYRTRLPAAAIVRKLVIGYGVQRSIHPHTLQLLLQSLPNVQSANLEPWRPVTSNNIARFYNGFGRLLEDLPPSLDRLCIFVESDCLVHYYERYPAAYLLYRTTSPPPSAMPLPRLARAVVAASRGLAVCSISFLAEADDVFAAIAQEPAATTWPRLRTLILTSSTLLPTSPPAAIAQLLLAAATAIATARMPCLRQCELWFSRGPHACVFSVDGTAADAVPRLYFMATWPGAAAALTRDVLQAWQAVTAAWTPRDLAVHIAPTPTTILTKTLLEDRVQLVLDARKLVLAGDSSALVRDTVLERTLQEMAEDRIWDRGGLFETGKSWPVPGQTEDW